MHAVDITHDIGLGLLIRNRKQRRIIAKQLPKVSLFRLSVDRRRYRTDRRPGVYSAGIAPTRRRRRRPRVGGAVRRTRFGPDLPIRQKTAGRKPLDAAAVITREPKLRQARFWLVISRGPIDLCCISI